jgi:hypothetical protein
VGTSVRHASAVCLHADAKAMPLSLQGTDALVFYQLDEAEVARRRTDRADRLDQLAALETLLQLPAGVPVSLQDLSAPVRAGIRRLPAGAVSVSRRCDRQEVTRRAVRPVTVDLAVVRATGRGWKSGLERASRFAPFCARAVLLDGSPSRLDDLLMEADFYGIGVLLADETGEVTMALRPEPYRPPYQTPGAWWFVEDVFQRLERTPPHPPERLGPAAVPR